MSEYIQVHTTVEKIEDACTIADRAIATRLAACVQIGGPVQSRYRWQGRLELATEYPLTLKSRADLFPALRALIEEIHPYEAPEILAMGIEQGSLAYLQWLDAELRPRP